MENKKHKILKLVVPVLCAVLVLAISLITPISAIVNSSQGSFNDYDITACSSFPLTVGFSYSTRDLSTGLGNSYVYSTYVGQFGEEFNKTIEGDESYTLVYDAGNGISPYNLTGKLSYTMLGQHWNETVYVNGANGAEGYFRRGYNGIVATNNTPASGNVSGYQQGVVLKASDVVFNPRSVYTITEEIENDTVVQRLNVITDPNVLVNVLPTFKTPDLVENEGGYGVTLTYSYNVKLRTPDNQEITFSDTETYDNRTEGYVGRETVPIIDPHSLIGVSGGYYFDTIVIEDYNGYLEYKYYTYTAPTISFTVGENSYTTQEGTTWQEFATSTDGFRYLDTSEGTGIQYQTGDNTWSEIYYNNVAVGPTDVIISGATYTITGQSPIPTISFTVGENSYTTQEGTTWQEFATSTDGFRYLDTSEGTGIQYEVAENTWSEIYYNNVAVGPTDVIISGATYTITEPSTEETLAGTWVFNSTIDLLYEDEGSSALVATFPFTDGYGNSWTRLAISFSSGKINYIDDIGDNGTLNVYTGTAWANSAYQTITTTATIDDVTVAPSSFTSQEFMTWLITNAVKQEGDISSGAAGNSLMDENDTVTTLSYNTDDDYNYSSEVNAENLATTSSGTWNEVNRSESCELELTYPLLDVSNVVNTGSNAYNSYYRWYSFPTVEKLLTSAEYAEAIPLPEVPQVDMTSWIGTAVGGFLNMELMPYFSIGGVLAIIIGFAVLMMILKWLAGG